MNNRALCVAIGLVSWPLSFTACSNVGVSYDAGRDDAGDGSARDGSSDGSTPSTQAGDRVFDESIVHHLGLQVAPEDWQSIVDEAAAYVNDNSEYPYFRARATFDGDELDGDISVRLKGHISIELSEGHSFPLKLDFNRYEDGLTLDGLKKLNLQTDFNGPTLPILRDYLSYGAWRQHGVAASRTSFAEVTVNDEALGIYVLLEQVDGDFIERHFREPFGDLYKPEQQTGTLEYRGPNIDDYPDIGHKWPDETDHAALLNALEVLDVGSTDDLDEVFDVEGVLTYLAGNVALGSADFYPSTGHNYYLYEETPGRFTMLPWDMNGSQESDGPPVCGPTAGYLSGKLLRNPDYFAMYRHILARFLEGAGAEDRLNSRLDAAERLLGSTLPPAEVDGLRDAIAVRTSRLAEELAAATTCP